MSTFQYALLFPVALVSLALFMTELLWRVKRPKNARYLKTKKIKRPATKIPWRL